MPAWYTTSKNPNDNSMFNSLIKKTQSQKLTKILNQSKNFNTSSVSKLKNSDLNIIGTINTVIKNTNSDIEYIQKKNLRNISSDRMNAIEQAKSGNPTEELALLACYKI